MSKLLSNLKLFLDFLPDGFVDVPKFDFEKEEISPEERNEIIKFAKEAFPYVYGYKKIFNDCCRIKEEYGIHTFIKDISIRSRFDKYIDDGGTVEQIRKGNVEEEYLSSYDIEIFKEAEREVHKEVHREVQERIVGQDKKSFLKYVEEGGDRLKTINDKINELRFLAGESPDWSSEIFEKIDEIEMRWVNYNNEPEAEDLDNLLSFYHSSIE